MSKVNLSSWMYGISGKTGNSVFVRTREGTVLRQRVVPANPQTVPQQAARGRFTTCSRLFEAFSQAQEDAWANYGNTINERDNVTFKSRKRLAMNAYMALATKWLQANGSGTPPSTPPTSEFAGDTVTITATAGTGNIVFTGSGANASGVTTEFLLQPLANIHRNPQKSAFRSKLISRYVGVPYTKTITVPAGFYAAAYRFVNLNTGQVSPMVELPIQTVALSIEKGGKIAAKKAA